MYPDHAGHRNYDAGRLAQQITPELDAAIRDAASRNPNASAQQISDMLADDGITALTASINAVLGVR